MRQSGKLTCVSWVLEKDHVVGVQTNVSHVLILVKFVLNEKYDADVVMVRPLGKQVGVGVVSFVHKIVDHQQLSIVKVVQVRQPLMERHSVNLDFLARFN